MKWIHPTSRRAAALVALAAMLCAGCQSRSTGMPNPFLAPNRVPPPATRALLPGQAQPYYPGDPLPVMQSQAPPVIDGSGLAWNAPNGGASPAPADVRPAPVAARGANEPTVAIPADSESLRFALPAPAPIEPEQFLPNAPSPIQFAAAPTVADQGVTPASYLASAQPVYNPWRSPTVPPPSTAPSLPAPPAVPTTVQPHAPLHIASVAGIPANTMDVRLRAVPSPQPRIRLPGETVPQPGYDGFRPRGSMR